MSTIDRASGTRAPRGRRGRDPLATRAVRMRNACVRHAAERLGIAAPDDAELRTLADDVSLRDAIEWWKARASGAVETALPAPPRRILLKTAVMTAVTLLGLAFSYGQVQ